MKEKELLQIAKERMGIDTLNDMQRKALEKWKSGGGDLVLYSPTGTGKTLAFALCVLQSLKPPMGLLQAVVVAPSRELVMQTAEILRRLADGYKVTPCYGGHAVADEKASLAVTPDIIVATPGRLLDHHKRGHIDLGGTRLLVLDEMDKSLELGFEEEMRQLLKQMPRLNRRILASATVLEAVPDYVRLHNPFTLNVLEEVEQPAERISVWQVMADGKDKLVVPIDGRRLPGGRHEPHSIKTGEMSLERRIACHRSLMKLSFQKSILFRIADESSLIVRKERRLGEEMIQQANGILVDHSVFL